MPKPDCIFILDNVKVKKCNDCKLIFSLDKFYYFKNKDSYSSYCRPCSLLRNKECDKKYQNKRKAYDKIYYEQNKERILSKENRQKRRNWKERNETRVKENIKKYQQRPEIKEKIRKRYKERMKNDIIFALHKKLRNLFKLFVKGHKKDSVINIIGCTLEEFKTHIENQFELSMNWQTHGNIENGWHFDHIVPTVIFNPLNQGEIKLCYNYRNIQPLFNTINCSKKDNLILAKEYLLKKIAKFGSDEIYQKLLNKINSLTEPT